MLNCLFFRIFSSVSFVSLYQTKAQRSGFCLELRSKGAERGMPSPAGRYTRSGLCDEVVGVGFCPIFGIWQDAGTPATSQMRCWLLRRHKLHILCFRAKRESSSIPLRLLSKSQSRCWIAILYFLRTLAQRWLFPLRRAHTRCRGRKPRTAATRASRRRTMPAAEGCKDANRSRRYPLTLLLRQTPEPLIGAALRKNAEISLCDFQRPL